MSDRSFTYRLVFKILRSFCPDQLYEEIEGDLIYQFSKDVKTVGEQRAKRRLIWNVIRFCRPGIVLRNKFSTEIIQLIMLENYFNTIYRQVIKNKVNAAFKLGTLTLSLFSFLIIAVYASYQYSFDRFHENQEHIFRVNSIRIENGNETKYATAPTALGPAIQEELPEVKSFTGISEWGSAMVRYEDRLLRLPHMIEADSSLFSVFTFDILKGSKEALTDPEAVILTESSARQIFGDQDPINKVIAFPDRFNRLLEVKAVIKDLPPNSSMNIDGIMNYGALRDADKKDLRSWVVGSGGNNLFVLLANGTNEEEFLHKVSGILKKNLAKTSEGKERSFRVFLQPLSEIYMGEPLKWEFDRKGNTLYLYIYLSLAFLLLIIASINYLNLSIADFTFRGKEMGVRKALGARKRQIAIQIVFETGVYCGAALLLSFALLYAFFPTIAHRIDTNLKFEMFLDLKIVSVIALMLLFLLLLSTAYPAYRLSLSNPVDDLRKRMSLVKGLSLNKILLLTQLSISLFCICATWAVSNQLTYIQIRDIGFDRYHLLTVLMPDRYPVEKASVLKSEMIKLAGVDAATFSYYHITGVPYFNAPYKIESGGEMKPVLLNELFVDENFLQTMDVKLLKGRNFRNAQEFKTAYIVNETAERELRLNEALGKRIIVEADGDSTWAEGTIVGVVKDFNTRSLHKKIEPLVIRLQYDSWPGNCLNVRYHGSEKEILASIKGIYERVLPEFLMDYEIVSERYDNQYQTEQKAYSIL